MKFIKYVAKYKDEINQAVEYIWNNQINSVKNEFLIKYYSELRDYFLAGGKRIRPLLSIAAYNAFKEDDDKNIILPSVGIEFLHNASLIHDDIIDNDDYRRGKPAFHFRYRQYHEHYTLKKMEAREFGRNLGIIGGDSAFILALNAYLKNTFDMSLNFNAMELYKEAFKEVSDGVLIEIDMVNQRNLTIDDYITMIKLKTGALIEKSLHIGAMYAQAPTEAINLLCEFGINIGIIFQIVDDILGTFGDETITGKPTDGDIREGKKTCLLISALNSSLDNPKKERLLDIIESPIITDQEVKEVRQLFIEAKAKEMSKELVEDYYNKTRAILDKLKPLINSEESEFFEDLLEFIIKRNF